jgi:hypothetical protein
MSSFRKRGRALDLCQKVLMMTREDLDALGVELMAADDAADPWRLAALAWRLYGEVGVIQAEIERLHRTLRAFRSPAGDQPPCPSRAPVA